MGEIKDVTPRLILKSVKEADTHLRRLRDQKESLIAELQDTVLNAFLDWEDLSRKEKAAAYRQLDRIIKEMKRFNRQSSIVKTAQIEAAKAILDKVKGAP